MASDQWTAQAEGNQMAYTRGDFTVVRVGKLMDGELLWEAQHHGQAIKSGNDPAELIKYCNDFAKSLQE